MHLIAREKATEMQWDFSEAFFIQPATHLANHIHIIINARDDKVSDFHPHAGLLHGEDGVEDGLQMTTTDPLVDIVAERLEVDVGSIEVGQEVRKGFLTDIASRDEDIPQSFFVSQTGTVRHIFYIGKGFRVGVGDARTMVLQIEADQLLRGEVVVVHLVRGDL